MKLVPPPIFIALLVIAFPGFSLFALTIHTLPNSDFRAAWLSRNAPNLSTKEKEARSLREEIEFLEEKGRFDHDEKTKADLALIEQSVGLLKAFHLKQIEAILGPRQEIQENYLLPAAFWFSAITFSADQKAGEATTAFFPIDELGGIYVIQYEKRETISGGALYLKRDHSFLTNDRTGDKRIEAREAERPELEVIKAALEQRIAVHRPE